MIKDIAYKGLSTTPSDFDCEDGDLAVSYNLLNEGDGLKVLQAAKVVKGASETGIDTFVAMHSGANYTHYIYQQGQELYFYKELTDNSSATIKKFDGDITINQVTAVGNMLVVSTTDGIYYFLWKDGEYRDLGNSLPELFLSFGLQGQFIESSTTRTTHLDYVHSIIKKCENGVLTTADTDDVKTRLARINLRGTFTEVTEDSSNYYYTFNNAAGAESGKALKDVTMAHINDFVKNKAWDRGKFAHPFFVRYAFRLYDGTLIKHSAPIFMQAGGTFPCIKVGISNYGYEDGDSRANHYIKTRVYGMAFDLDVSIPRKEFLGEIAETWKDIITSVDIFVSAPIYTYEADGDQEKFQIHASDDSYNLYYWNNKNNCCVCKFTQQNFQDNKEQKYQFRTFQGLRNALFGYVHKEGIAFLLPPLKSEAKIKEEVENCGTFYLLKSIKLKDLQNYVGNRKKIEIESSYLESLTTRETMTDDFYSHENIIAGSSYVYNKRLNVSNISKIMQSWFNPYSLIQYTNGYLKIVDTKEADEDGREFYVTEYKDADGSKYEEGTSWERGTYTYCFHLKKNGKEIVLRNPDTTEATASGETDRTKPTLGDGSRGYNAPITYVFYPDPDAYQVDINYKNSGSGTVKLELTQHPTLNGAYCTQGIIDMRKATGYVHKESDLEDRTYKLSATESYVSEVENPFLFISKNVYDATQTGQNAEQIGMVAAVKALSQGQFGQFPLYNFTSLGVWAVCVEDDGTYKSVQPVTRDVCINAESITSLDQGVLFATTRGLIYLEGSESVCISDILNGKDTYDFSQLPRIDDIANTESLNTENIKYSDFITYISEGGCIYDYAHQRIYVYSNGKYAYVYSLKSKKWCTMQSTIKNNLTSYPNAYATLNDGSVVDLTKDADNENYIGFLVTRPFVLDAPTELKTITEIIQRGYFREGHVKQVLYGSRDFQNWHIIASSKDHYLRGFSGTPYKCFRLAVLCTLEKDESLTGFSVIYNTKYTNRLR